MLYPAPVTRTIATLAHGHQLTVQGGPQPVAGPGAAVQHNNDGSGGLASQLETPAPLDPDLQNLPGSPDDRRHDCDDHRPVGLPVLPRRLMPPISAEGHFAPLYSYGHLFP